MDLSGILVGCAALISSGTALVTALNKSRVKKIDSVCKDMAELKEDVGIIKEASFFSLQGQVEQGVNGDVKKAHEKLKKIIFKE